MHQNYPQSQGSYQEMAAKLGSAIPTPLSPIAGAIDHLRAEINATEGALGELLARLSPIVQPAACCSTEGKESPPVSCELEGQIRDLTLRVAELYRRISAAHHYLCI